MASDTSICNLALSHLGDRATVSSIDPPEGSAQADHCAMFYPLARDALLEAHDWGFATRRAALAPLTNDSEAWAYCYGVPADLLRARAIQHVDASDDLIVGGIYQPQAFKIETLFDDTKVLRTNQEDALLRYTALVDDTAKFSPLFTTTLSYLLASYLAGPVIKGEPGRKAAIAMQQMSMLWLAKATTSDAGQQRMQPRDQQHTPGSIASRL